MPIEVETPSGLVEFPDGTPVEEMQSALRRRFGAPKIEVARRSIASLFAPIPPEAPPEPPRVSLPEPEKPASTGPLIDEGDDWLGVGEEFRGTVYGAVRGGRRAVQSLDLATMRGAESLRDTLPGVTYDDAKKRYDAARALGLEGMVKAGMAKTASEADSVLFKLQMDAVNAKHRDRYVKRGEKAAESFAKQQEAIEKLPLTRAQAEFQKEETPWWHFFKNPVELSTVTMAESAPAIAATVAAAPAGPVAVAGAAGLTSFNAESAARVTGAMQEAGVDLKDPKAVAAWFADRAKSKPALAKADLAALGPATFDALTAGLAGRFLGPALGKGMRPVATATAKEMGVQMAGGGAGTLAASALAGEPVDWKDFVLEVFSEFAPVEAVSNVRAERARQAGTRARAYAPPTDVPSPTVGQRVADEFNRAKAAERGESEPPPIAPEPKPRAISSAEKILRARGAANDVALAVSSKAGEKRADETGEDYRNRVFALHDEFGFAVPKETRLPFMSLDVVRDAAIREGDTPQDAQRRVDAARVANDEALKAVSDRNLQILSNLQQTDQARATGDQAPTPTGRQRLRRQRVNPQVSSPENPIITPSPAPPAPLTPDQRAKLADNLRGSNLFTKADMDGLDAHIKRVLGANAPTWSQMAQSGDLKVEQQGDQFRVEVPPLNPGGAESALPSAQQAQSRRNNSIQAFAEANGIPYVEGDTPEMVLAKIKEKTSQKPKETAPAGETLESGRPEQPTPKNTPPPPVAQSVTPDVTQAPKYRIGTSPQTFTLVERLPQSETERENNEQPVRVRNDQTGKEQTVLESDLTAVQSREPVAKDVREWTVKVDTLFAKGATKTVKAKTKQAAEKAARKMNGVLRVHNGSARAVAETKPETKPVPAPVTPTPATPVVETKREAIPTPTRKGSGLGSYVVITGDRASKAELIGVFDTKDSAVAEAGKHLGSWVIQRTTGETWNSKGKKASGQNLLRTNLEMSAKNRAYSQGAELIGIDPPDVTPEWAKTVAKKKSEFAQSDDTFTSFDVSQHERAVRNAIALGNPVPPEVLADYPDLRKGDTSPVVPKAETPAKAVAKVEQHVEQTARTEGQRPAKEVKSELVERLEAAHTNAKSESEILKDETVSATIGTTVRGSPIAGKRPLLESVAAERKNAKPSQRIMDAYKKALEDKAGKITIEIPGDGTFVIFNTKEAIGEVLGRAKKISTSSGEQPKVKYTGTSKADREWVQEQLSKNKPGIATNLGNQDEDANNEADRSNDLASPEEDAARGVEVQPGMGRTNQSQPAAREGIYEDGSPPKTGVEQPDTGGITAGAQSSAEILRTSPNEISRLFVAAGRSPNRGARPQPTNGPNGGGRLAAGAEGRGEAAFENNRIFIASRPNETDSRVGLEATINFLASRILAGASGSPAATFSRNLLSRLRGLKIVFTDNSSPSLAFYNAPSDAIIINTRLLGGYDTSKAEDIALLDAAISEEVTHALTERLSTTQERTAVWNSLSETERSEVRKAYPRIDSPDHGGHEYLRMILQERLFGKISEQSERKLSQKVKDILLRVVNFLKESFGVRPENALAREIIARLEGAINGDAPIPYGVNDKVLVASNATVVAPHQPIPTIVAHHGTPHEIRGAFSTDKIGTGEGAQVYGWGLYFAGNQAVSKQYAEKLAANQYPSERQLREYFKPGRKVPAYGGGRDTVVAFKWENGSFVVTVEDEQGTRRTHSTPPSQKQLLAAGITSAAGNEYTVTLNVEPEDLLDWDKPLSEQSEKIQSALFMDYGAQAGASPRNPTGAAIYAEMEAREGGRTWQSGGKDGSKLASQYLLSLGIKGIRFLDQGSRFNYESRYNYQSREFVVSAPGSGVVETFPAGNNRDAAKAKAEARVKELNESRTYNYVIFNDADITITHENGKEVPVKEAMGLPPGFEGATGIGTSLGDEQKRLDREMYGDEMPNAQQAGVRDAGTARPTEHIDPILQQVREKILNSQEKLTPELIAKAWQLHSDLTDNSKNLARLQELRNTVGGDAMLVLLQDEIGRIALKQALETGDQSLLTAYFADSEDFLTTVGGRTAAGRTLRGARDFAGDPTWMWLREVYQKERIKAAQEGSKIGREEFLAIVDSLRALKLSEAEIVAQLEAAETSTPTKGKPSKPRAAKKLPKPTLRELAKIILSTPRRANTDPQWRRDRAQEWLEEQGFSKEEATEIADDFSKVFDEAWAKAAEREAERVLGKKNPQLQEMIRLGVLDPGGQWIDRLAEKHGWRKPTKEEFQKLLDLDEQANNPDLSPLEYHEIFEQKHKIMRRIGKRDGQTAQLLSESFAASLLSGIRTQTVQLAPYISSLRDLVINAPFDLKNSLNLYRSMFNSAKANLAANLKYTWQKNVTLFYEKELESNFKELERLHEDVMRTFKTGNVAQKALAAGKWIYAQQRFVIRLLNTMDSTSAAFLREWKLAYYSSMVLKDAGLGHQELSQLMDAIELARRNETERWLDQGMNKTVATLRGNRTVDNTIRQFMAGKEISPEQTDQIFKSAEHDYYRTLGRRSQGQQENEEGFLSNIPFIGPNNVLKMVAEQRAKGGWSAIIAQNLFGFVSIPWRATRAASSFGPYGLFRYGVHKYRKAKGKDTFWKQSFATALQERARFREALAGTIVWGAAIAWALSHSSADDGAGDEDLAMYITGSGPDNKVLREAWLKRGFRPYSINLVVNGRIATIPLTRVNEPAMYPFIVSSAIDNAQWKRKQDKAAGKPARPLLDGATSELLGTHAAMMGQRGLLQTASQIAQMTQQEGSLKKGVARYAAGTASGIGVPFKQALASISEMTYGPLDYSSASSMVANAFPIIGLPWQQRATNRFGDPMYDQTWYGKVSRLGVPIAFQVARSADNERLYPMLVDKGVAPPELSRSAVEEKFGSMTDEKFAQYVERNGTLLKRTVLNNLSDLRNQKPETVKKFLNSAAQQAEKLTALGMGLTPQVEARRERFDQAIERASTPIRVSDIVDRERSRSGYSVGRGRSRLSRGFSTRSRSRRRYASIRVPKLSMRSRLRRRTRTRRSRRFVTA